MSAPPLLFEPLRFRSVTVRNRIMISPMCQYCAAEDIPGDWHFVHLGSRAVGGAGIVMAEATAVEPAGRITSFDLGLWNDVQEAAFARIALWDPYWPLHAARVLDAPVKLPIQYERAGIHASGRSDAAVRS